MDLDRSNVSLFSEWSSASCRCTPYNLSSFRGSRFGHINLTRCPEYDQRIIGEKAVTHPDYSHEDRANNDLFPYTPLLKSLEKWEELLVKAHKEKRRAEAHWDADSDEFQQMDSAIKHIWQVEVTILDERTIFSGSALPENTEARIICIGSYMRAFRSRIGHYPLEDTVDGAMTVIVKDLCRTFEVHNLSDPDNLRDNFLFFRSLDGATFPYLTPNIMALNDMKATLQIINSISLSSSSRTKRRQVNCDLRRAISSGWIASVPCGFLPLLESKISRYTD